MARQLTRIEARSIDYVPDSERHGKVSDQGPFWFLGNFHFFTIAVGFVGPSLHLALGWTALAATLGILFGTLFQAFHASQGAELGLPQMIQSRAQFGYRGVVVPVIGAVFTFVGFNVINSILVAEGLNHLWGWDTHAVIVGLAVVAAALAIWGHDWLHLAFRSMFLLSLPLFTVLSLGIALGFVHGNAPAEAPAAGFSWPAFAAQFAAAASYNITYAPYVSDYTRYLPRTVSRAAIIVNVFLGAALSAIWLICLGAWLASRMGATDGLSSLSLAGNGLMPHLGDGLVICSVAALQATMGMNAYSGMLSVVTGLDSVRQIQPTRRIRVVTILLLAAVWTWFSVTAQGDAIEILSATLVAMLYLLCPWTAVNLMDYFFLRKGRYAIIDLARPDGIYGAFGVRGLAAYFAGLAASVPFFLIPGLWTGPAAKALGGVDIAWLIGLIVAAVVYMLASRGFSAASEEDAIAASDAELGALARTH
ncbi:MAG: cytosine permease [Novosphingobium sp.]|nr:cytosine permease [Novosphingobium sp.]